MYRRIINRYLDKVLKYLPIRDRRKARKIISDMIYEVLEDYIDGKVATPKEVREALRELGTPGDLAYAYYAEFHKPLTFQFDVKKILNGVFRFISVLAFVFVAAGVISLAMGRENTIYIVFGTILGVLVVLYQMAVSAGQEKYAVRDIQSRIL